MGFLAKDTAHDAAPAYEDVVNEHPVNRYLPSGSTSSYTTVPQNDDVDIELHAHTHHNHNYTPSPSTNTTSSPSEQPTFAQTIANVLRPAHTHCEVCDNQAFTAAKHKREKEQFCCTMVAATFMTLFICIMLLGIVISNNMRKRSEHHGGS
ncbi:Hybrid signal transduction histidine kinase B [Pyrenophora seminiperda CCB06]|uniref:Hybrid signal transduction histidine kinase B n=1 Tax=Pyrenophora seminiperda CCB06 TaxID=1302712 RepID=A0A3M7M540_9PLEO|nr:Hybrid signal transduction histidine kinase B [Pyrenophora seminiperda CCB06]